MSSSHPERKKMTRLKATGLLEYCVFRFPLFAVTTAMLCFGFAVPVHADIQIGLVSHWPMDDDAANNAVVDAVGGANGTYERPFGTPVNTDVAGAHNDNRKEGTGSLEFGSFGQSTSFLANGLSYGGVGNEMTLAFWFNPDTTLTSASPRFDLFSNFSSSTPGGNQYNFIYNAVGGGSLEWRLGSDPTRLDSTINTFTSGTWYHVAATLNTDADAVLYINGVADISANASDALNGSFEDFAMGTNAGVFNFDGLIDDVRIYKRVLSAEDVGELFALRGGTDPPAITDFTWDGTSGDWNVAGNWTPNSNGALPGNSSAVLRFSHTATFGNSIGSDAHTVFTNTSVTVNAINFTNTLGGTYRIAGGPNINLMASTETLPTLPSIVVAAGSHEFQAPVGLHAATIIDIASRSSLEFNNRLNLNGNTVTKTGHGVLAISNDVVLDGGTINLQQGTIVGNGTVGGDVINDGGTISPGNRLAGGGDNAGQVPEPASILLIGLGFPMLMVARRFRR